MHDVTALVLVGFSSLIVWSLLWLFARNKREREDAAVIGVSLLAFYTVTLTVACNLLILRFCR